MVQSWMFKKSIFSGRYLERMVSIREEERERERAKGRAEVPFRKSQSQQNIRCLVIRRETVLDGEQRVECMGFFFDLK
jgi:hypothetical protein